MTGTFNHLKALDNPALGLEGAEPAPERPSKIGCDPYATTIVLEKPKTRR